MVFAPFQEMITLFKNNISSGSYSQSYSKKSSKKAIRQCKPVNKIRNNDIELIRNPKPVIFKNKKYCPFCWKNKIKTELKTARQFLCKNHYKEFNDKYII